MATHTMRHQSATASLARWLLVAPLKGQPAAAGLVPAALAIGPFVNAAWGLGTAIGLELFGRPHK